ncbi:MAG TPA: ATP-binding protein [Anaerolineales bacterium]|nr:ATP-binding protein [Anaerolineales bacterium]HNE05002.1 ATP-binding protein [Anaerolineales bacterium]
MESKSPKLSPEMLVPRLGEYLVQKGLISEIDLQRALNHQQDVTYKGGQSLLGQALIELKLIDKDTLDQVITEQIIQLRSALQSANRNLEQRVRERTSDLNEALNRLSELSQMKANFVSNISHELRTPLTHIKGYIELMLAESLGPISDEQRHALTVSQRSTGKLEDMIEDLIMFSLASRGEMSMKLEGVDIRRLVSLVTKTAMRKAEDRGVKLEVLVKDDTPYVQADGEKISWVVGQLIDNGIKFTPSGGSVTVAIEEEGKNLVQVIVRDTGVGIPQDRMKEIFEPFHQLDGSSTRRYGGTGLGLSLVRQIVEGHGSLLDVKSTEGKGTTFKFPLLAMRD